MTNIKRLRETLHNAAAACGACGADTAAIAALVGCSETRIRLLLADPAFRHLVSALGGGGGCGGPGCGGSDSVTEAINTTDTTDSPILKLSPLWGLQVCHGALAL